MAEDFEVIVVGGGPAGEHAAGRCRDYGLRTALVESELVGGECSYWACMPSKTLLRPGTVLATARDVPGAREAVNGPLSAEAALARRDWMTADWDDRAQVDWLDSTGAVLRRGRGRLSGERTITVTAADGSATELTATRAIILATGSDPFLPPITGLDSTRYWSNREATAAKEVPRRLLVLGGGPVGVELAQAWRRLGSEEVSLVEAGERLLGREEPFAGEQIAQALRAEGIVVRTGVAVTEVHRDVEGPVTALLSDGSTCTADELLVAVGRRPRTGDLGLERVGLTPGKPVTVDDAMRVTGVDGGWLFAIGDVNGRALLTHMGKYHARVAVDTIVGKDARDVADGLGVPRVVFTDPEVASVGLTEAEARGRGLPVRVLRCETNEVPAASIARENVVGTCQLVVDAEREVLVGATFVGSEIAELLHSATVAIVGEVPLARLRHAVAAYPTESELWLKLVEEFGPEPHDSVPSKP